MGGVVVSAAHDSIHAYTRGIPHSPNREKWWGVHGDSLGIQQYADINRPTPMICWG